MFCMAPFLILMAFANVIKICHASDVVKLIGSFPVDPSDVGLDEKHLYMKIGKCDLSFKTRK